MALDLTQKTYKKETGSRSRILLGVKLPKNYQEIRRVQRDPKNQELSMAWAMEKDPELRKQKWQALKDYWAELGVKED